MKYIMIKCLKSDDELIKAATSSFNNVDVIEEDGFSGGGEWITIAIPLFALGVQIADFILTHLVKSPQDTESETKKKENRLVVEREGETSLLDSSKEDVIKYVEDKVKTK